MLVDHQSAQLVALQFRGGGGGEGQSARVAGLPETALAFMITLI